MSKTKTCFLFGHRDAPYTIQPDILAAMERHYDEYQVRHFVMGNYGSFDRMAQGAARRFRETHADITLYLLIPYHPSLRPQDVPDGFDGTFYPEGQESTPLKYAISRANQYMLRHADTVICYVSHIGNTRRLLEQAQRMPHLRVDNLAASLYV